jgi:O-antigen/teichoic acid export membrane protein
VGLNGTNLRFIPTYKGQGEPNKIKGSITWTLRVSLTISLFMTLLIFLFPSEFCAWFIHRPDTITQETWDLNIVNAFQFYAVSIVMTAVYAVFISSLTGLQEIKYKVLAGDIAGPAAKTISLLLFFFFGWELYAALGSNLIQDAVVLAVSLYFLLKAFPELKDHSFKTVYQKKEMNKFAATLFSNSLLGKYTYQLDIIFLGLFTTTRDVGIYTASLRLQSLIYLPHYTISTIFGPLVAELYASGKMDELERLYKTVTKWTFSISLPIFTTVILFAAEILNVFGKDFSEGALIIIFMSVGNLIHDLFGLSSNIIMMTGRIKVNLANSAVMAFINLILYYFLIQFCGIMGAAVGNGLSMVILNTLTLLEVRYFLGITPFKKSLFKPVLSMFFSVGIVEGLLLGYRLPMYQVTFVLYIFLLWGLYFMGLFFLRFDEEDKFIIKKIMNRFSFLRRLLPSSYQ